MNHCVCKFANHSRTALFCRTAFELEEDNRAKLPPRILSPIKQEPSTSTTPEDTKSSASPQVTKSSAAPQVTKCSAAPQVTKSSDVPEVAKSSASPQVTKSSAAPQVTKCTAASRVTKSAPSSKKKNARASSQVRKPEKEKSAPFLTRAFFNTVAPGLASFAQTQKSDLDIIVEEEDEVEEDPDVIAIMADF